MLWWTKAVERSSHTDRILFLAHMTWQGFLNCQNVCPFYLCFFCLLLTCSLQCSYIICTHISIVLKYFSRSPPSSRPRLVDFVECPAHYWSNYFTVINFSRVETQGKAKLISKSRVRIVFCCFFLTKTHPLRQKPPSNWNFKMTNPNGVDPVMCRS